MCADVEANVLLINKQTEIDHVFTEEREMCWQLVWNCILMVMVYQILLVK